MTLARNRGNGRCQNRQVGAFTKRVESLAPARAPRTRAQRGRGGRIGGDGPFQQRGGSRRSSCAAPRRGAAMGVQTGSPRARSAARRTSAGGWRSAASATAEDSAAAPPMRIAWLAVQMSTATRSAEPAPAGSARVAVAVGQASRQSAHRRNQSRWRSRPAGMTGRWRGARRPRRS